MANPSKLQTIAANINAGIQRHSYTVAEFCAMHGMSIGLYQKQRKEGLTPREFRVGRRVMITVEAEAEWLAAREAAAAVAHQTKESTAARKSKRGGNDR
ncbi:hypothetical protein [Bradyrhizobium diazoefficiens]